MPKPKSRHLRFKLLGSTRDAGLVRAVDLADVLEGVVNTLRVLEKQIPAREKTVYRVIDLSISSAVIEVEAIAPKEFPARAAEVVTRFTEGVNALRDGNWESIGYDPDLQRALASLMKPLRRDLRSIEVSTEDGTITLSGQDAKIFSQPEEEETAAVGTLAGFIDAINVHAEPVFYLYPSSGPVRIPCVFDRTLLDDVRDALKQYTTVHGLLEYKEKSAFPFRIVVEHLEIAPPLETLPTLASLWGAAPQITGGLDPVTFVRRQRDAEP